MPLSFTAIDFETANRSPASACAIGVVRVRDGAIVETQGHLIRPPTGADVFAPFNVHLHGIGPGHVVDAPGWGQLLPDLVEMVGDDVVVAHNARFDMGVAAATSRAVGAPIPPWRFSCSLRMARHTFVLRSYALPSAARAAGFELRHHHDASADAEACAAIVLGVAHAREVDDWPSLEAATRVAIEPLAALPGTRIDRLIRNATF